MKDDPHSAARELNTRLTELGDPARATKEKAYLRSDLQHRGVKVPLIRRETRAAIASLSADKDTLVAFAEELWAIPVHESRVAAVEVLIRKTGLLDQDDMPMLDRLIRESETWALVDSLATSVVGPVVEHDSRAAKTLDAWAKDDDFWVRRASMLALLKQLRAGRGDFERFSRYADSMLAEKEFFIRKAIGWVLRETSKLRPDLVYAWILPRARAASGVTVREAVRYLEPDQRDEVMRAYEVGRRTSGANRRKRPRK